MTIFLIGMMGVGKSTVGKRLSNKLGIAFVDLDLQIEEMEKKTITDIFNQDGEAYFRMIESVALKKNIQKNAVVSCGGGIVLKKENHHILKSGMTIYLKANIHQLEKRISNSNHRPLLANKKLSEELKNILNKREDKYLELSTMAIDTNNNTSSEVTNQIYEYITHEKN